MNAYLNEEEVLNEYQAESQNDRDAEERAIELLAEQKEDSAVDSYIEDQALNG